MNQYMTYLKQHLPLDNIFIISLIVDAYFTFAEEI